MFKFLVDKDSMVTFNNKSYAVKVKVFEVDSIGLWARCYKIETEKVETPKGLRAPLPNFYFIDETEDTLTFYPWTAIKSVKIIGKENE